MASFRMFVFLIVLALVVTMLLLWRYMRLNRILTPDISAHEATYIKINESPASNTAQHPLDPINAPKSWLLPIMTFNLRYANAGDGPNRWENRRDHVADIINRYHPLVLGTQEGLADQLADLHKRLKHPYERFGKPRNPGDEHCQIFYDPSRLTKLEDNTFWLSESMKPGERGWDASHVRIATWGRFREIETGEEFVIINTQLDDAGVIAREEGAKLIWRQMKSVTAPLLLIGDFNTLRETPVHVFLTTDTSGPLFTEAWMVSDKKLGTISNSYHAFSGPKYDESYHPDWIAPEIDRPDIVGHNHIDWIFTRPATRVLVTDVITEARKGRYPSDHYPVYAEVVMQNAAN